MHEWSKPVIDAARKKGMDVDCISGPEVTRAEIASRMKKCNPGFVVLNGHGCSDTFFGHDNKPAICTGDAGMLSGKIVFSRACDCASKLGKCAVDCGCKSFIGYQYEFVNVRKTSSEIKPLQDDVSKPIWETSNAVPLGLIKGAPVAEAVEKSHRAATKELSRLLFSSELGAMEVMKALIVNDDSLTYHGSGDAVI
jgi:hypothetical protein